MNNKLKFHIDSARAFANFENRQKVQKEDALEADQDLLNQSKLEQATNVSKEFNLAGLVSFEKMMEITNTKPTGSEVQKK